MEYIEIKEQIKQKLPVARDLGDSENLLELGLSSLTIMRLVNQWRKQGVKVSFGSLMENPTLEGWWALIQRSMKKKAGKKRAQESKITPEKDMKQPFPLTDVQYAYWVGRDEEQALGGIDCHAYLEFDGGNIDPERLEKAWNVLQYHHPMLRACFLDDGTQKILDKPYCEKIKVHDFSRMSSEEAEAMAVSVRERLSHRKLKIEEGEVAGIELTLFPENKARLHVDMALLVADVQSLQILLRDLASAYRGENLPKESKGWNFASYLERQKQEEGEERKNAEKYWKNRLEHLPKGPDLPLAKRPQEVEKTVFNRRIVRIEKEEWDHLQMRAKKYQTTPAMVLLTAYAVVLERWSRNHCFLINIPFFNRKTEQQGLEEVIADFTTLLLLEINCEENPTFAELLDRIQKQLHEDMKYTAYSGVQVQRDIAQMCGDASAVAPVVFACNLGTPLVNDTFRNELGQFSYMISQTPQVWNDFQSYEDENGVQLTWDSVDELFPENMIPDMLESFEILLHELGKKDWNQRFDVLPEKRKREIEDTARTGVPERVECLHWAVMNHAEVCPEDIALIDAGSGRSVSYGELKARATAVAAGISEKDIKGVPVALTLPRGIEQIESALGILLSGNSYLPVSLSQPKDRRALIHEKTGVRYVVTNRELSEKLDWPEGTEILVMEGMEEGQENVRMPEVSPKDSAYIIMTSGSTGVPKGVEIAHESAWNTVQDINEKYHVTSADRALAVSAMDFDLSVYDVFGILGAGGTLVLLPEQERRNADYWLEQVLKYQITVWNSVPVLLDMLLIRAESMKQKLPIRAVMLSGDWIGMDLPQRVAAWTEDCQFVAMGGATEASIWSNYQNVTLPMPKNWKSIPYGKPLRYQAYRVVDEYGRDCPYWAEGELWIGGFGVAKGYRGDSALTGQKFITDQYGRWYRTGDLGRIWDDEIIEFLGRKDHQVKIRGHRIELGEIEHAIQEFPGVAHAVVDTVSDGHGNKTLAAYIGAPIQEDSKVTTYLYGTDIFGGGWKELKDDVSNWQMQQERKTAYKNFLAYADQRCVQLMLETLIELGIFVSEKEVLSQKEIFEKGSITETQKNTVARWLEILKKEGILREEDGRLSRTGKEVAVPEKAGDAETYFKKLKPYLKHMVTGNEVPLDVFYQKEPALAPNMLLRRIPGCEETVERLVQGLRLLAEERRKEPLQIIEIGTRDTAITRQFLNALEDVSVAYTYADSSKYFLQEAEKELAGYERVEFEMLNLEEGMDKQQMSLHSYDVVISVNALHRNIDAADAVKKVAELLKPNGILLMTDLVVRTYLQELTAAFLENGFADIRDKRKEAGLVTPDCLLWRECLSEAGLGEDCAVTERYGRCICCSRQQASVLSYHNGALREYLSEKLPEYMVPQNYHFMEQLPTLSNGKINRKQLREDFKEETAVIRFSKATTETEEKLLDIWKQLFGYENIGIEDNYFSLGGDSLIATRLISEVQTTFGCKITISTIFENLTVKSLAKAIEQSEQKEEDTLQIKPNLEEAYHSFPLTDVQYAYWLGRSGLYELGNVATHCYFELDADGLDTECAETAYGIADELQKCSCKAGDYVGIKLNKSFFQIASVLGTLLIGAAFVPIDNDQPEIRADKILEIAKIKCLIGEKEETHKYREKYKWIDKDSVILKKSYDEIVNDNFDDVAYVIFTSGSTGEPKGVVIEQQAVVNTIIDINERFQVKDKDSILALSQLHFDLSVYDIFGMLATGGTIVIPEKVRYKDPSYWLMLVEKWNITVWNSVPAFMEMFVDYLERFYKGEKLSINKILLSGDWIPVKLPEKICRFLKDVRIYSLGGATEASIWSIYHECKMGESYNSSIPYGVPLSNQGFEVLDANMKPCPDMVQGELYITGKGLAKEYLGDVSKTQSSFFWLNNKRIYKTGDFGRYLRNGEIEFLGRKDSQIKISGHRIDTGEIENAIMDCCSGKNCCVTTVDWNNEPKLVAVIVPKEDEKKDEKSVREALKRYLPQYMIPFFLQFIDEIPCTSNGKVDRQAIRKLFIDKRDDKIQHKRWELENLIDKEIYSILISVLKVDALYPDDNLFELGADSLLMAQIAGRVKEIIEQTKTSVTFDEILRQILNNPTGEAITTFVKSKQNILTSENVRTDDFRIIEKTAKDTVYIFFHTALGTTNCYRFVEKELRKEDLGDFLFINVEDVEWYYSIQYHELVDRITDEYVRKIEQLHYKNINLIGYCLGGILALNVAVKLLEKGIEVNNLFVIDSYPVSGKVEDQFIDEVIFLPNYQLMLSEVLEDVDDFKVMEFITEVRKRNNGNIPQNTFFNIIEKDTKMKNNSGLWEFVNSTKEKRFEAYAKAIEKKTCINVSAELLEATFEIYQHGFKGANVELPFYSGDICYLSACEEQKYFFADKNQNLEMWNDICLGEFEVINVPGNHVTCIHSEENATLLAQIIIERNIRG
ncbi:amino acid adenylation domain-containing protein [Mediterraneibacter sp. 210702-DFI.3.120]|nr:non-ribosomal peptide synthetase [Mediterraneibacter sp. 210702-DFI.3.120]MCB5939120.1 amino acid adenylation domain-containing protein [Lachnospiraceae bacterium 210521-DFI.3.107]MCB6485849.1 amino acid adenylation domain-containing protein [Mediterraneibacter sp. 210702-DFI.3.120]